LIVILEADLVDQFNPGDEIVVVGSLLRQWRPVYKGARCEVDIALSANSVKSLNTKDRTIFRNSEYNKLFFNYWNEYRSKNQELSGRDNIIRAVCPQLYGLYGVKLALLLTLIGGTDELKRRKNNEIQIEAFQSPRSSSKETENEQMYFDTSKNLMKTRSQSHLLMGDYHKFIIIIIIIIIIIMSYDILYINISGRPWYR